MTQAKTAKLVSGPTPGTHHQLPYTSAWEWAHAPRPVGRPRQDAVEGSEQKAQRAAPSDGQKRAKQRRTTWAPGRLTTPKERDDSKLKSLDELADDIRQAHHEYERCMEKALAVFQNATAHRVRIGELLIRVKLKLKRSQPPVPKWEDWVEKHLPFSVRTAQVYMRTARNKEQLKPYLDGSRPTSLAELQRVLDELGGDGDEHPHSPPHRPRPSEEFVTNDLVRQCREEIKSWHQTVRDVAFKVGLKPTLAAFRKTVEAFAATVTALDKELYAAESATFVLPVHKPYRPPTPEAEAEAKRRRDAASKDFDEVRQRVEQAIEELLKDKTLTPQQRRVIQAYRPRFEVEPGFFPKDEPRLVPRRS
jgi:hypothetical protein